MATERTIVKTTCPRDCYDSCGIRVIIEDGAIRQVTGDQEHFSNRGGLCGKCTLAYNGAWRDPAQRLLYPMKRVGKKGRAEFTRVSWDEAIGETALRLKAILAARSAETIFQTHYTGTCSAIAGNFPLRFFKRLGAVEVDPDTVCNKAGHEALKYILGDSTIGFDPRTAKDSKCVVVWGANPYASAPHVHKHWLRQSPGTLIVIDPIAHESAKAADIFLQVRPGTDAALAFAMLHVIQREGLLREDFLAAHTIGWEEVVADVAAMTPERGAALTDVPADKIREAALIYGRGPSLMWLGQGMQRQRMGGNAFRASALLCAATANIGKPGAGLLFLNGSATRGVSYDYVVAPHLSRNGSPTLSHMDLATTLADPARSQALLCWNNNIVASNPQQTQLRAALEREDLLHVAIDLFPTDTTDYADFVLPAASFLEFDDVLLPYFYNALSAQAQAVKPMGECLPNQEIFRRLSAAMDFSEPELFEPDASIIDTIIKQAGYDGTFESLKIKGSVYPTSGPIIQFESLEFPTPSGKIEIASERAAADGHPRAPIPHADQATAADKLRVLSPASEWMLNSSYGNDRKIQRQLGKTVVMLNPREAEARGVGDGASVELANETGRLPLVVETSVDVPMGVALVHKGRWPKHDPSHANVNILNPGAKTDMGESSCVHAVEAELVVGK
ncbi:MAG TPA: molybdopterin-dependent oxidoreductase [Candidatus Binataceae bacterium]|nr:molybdopterin-dependent oxidoreductase [Candidatus Binataceae bacterium]